MSECVCACVHATQNHDPESLSQQDVHLKHMHPFSAMTAQEQSPSTH